MFCLALTLLSATLLAADYKVYEITETKESFAGLYVETSRPSLSFQRIGGKVNDRFYHLFRRSALSAEWKIGYAVNKASKSKTISFRAKPVLNNKRDVPPMSGWKSTSGKEKSFKVIERSSLVYTLEQAEASGGSLTQDGGIVCLEQNSNLWILLKHDDPRICDKVQDCKNGLDNWQAANCPKGKIVFGKINMPT